MPIKPIEQLIKEKKKEPPKSVRNRFLIGIDPDTIKSGVASFLKQQGVMQDYSKIKITLLSFFELFEFLKVSKELYGSELLVVIEAGWKNKKSNYHNNETTPFVREKIAHDIGRNHQSGIHIEEMCLYLDVRHELIQPSSNTQKKKNKKNIKIVHL